MNPAGEEEIHQADMEMEPESTELSLPPKASRMEQE